MSRSVWIRDDFRGGIDCISEYHKTPASHSAIRKRTNRPRDVGATAPAPALCPSSRYASPLPAARPGSPDVKKTAEEHLVGAPRAGPLGPTEPVNASAAHPVHDLDQSGAGNRWATAPVLAHRPLSHPAPPTRRSTATNWSRRALSTQAPPVPVCGHERTPRAPARARLPLLPSSPGGVQRDDTTRGVAHECSGPGRKVRGGVRYAAQRVVQLSGRFSPRA